MTATPPTFILQSIENGVANMPSTTLGIILAVLLLILVALKEFIRGSDAPQRQRHTQAFNFVIIPLLLAFALIAIIRIVNLLNL